MGKKSDLQSATVMKRTLPPVVYGLKGIMELFNVSKSTAWVYKNTFLADACVQKGRKILVDTKKALELYGLRDIHKMDILFADEKKRRNL